MPSLIITTVFSVPDIHARASPVALIRRAPSPTIICPSSKTTGFSSVSLPVRVRVAPGTSTPSTSTLFILTVASGAVVVVVVVVGYA